MIFYLHIFLIFYKALFLSICISIYLSIYSLFQVLLAVHGPEPDGGRGGGPETCGPLPHQHNPPDQALDKDTQGHYHAPHQWHHPGSKSIQPFLYS